MRENLSKKSNKASIQNHAETGNSSEASQVRLFTAKQKKSINTDISYDVKEDAVYMDTASDVYTL